MNDNSIIINNYLQNEMSATEKAAFEERLTKDAALQHELYIQQQVINAVVHAGLKASFAKAIRKKIMVRRYIMSGIAAGIIVMMILIVNYRQDNFSNKIPVLYSDGVDRKQGTNSSQPFINPPLKAVDIPFTEYSFDAEKGDTIFHTSGSVIYFPPASLVDESGNPVKGVVNIRYREFADPLDFFVSGIPMQYDSAGRKYNFESSGMCEVNAYRDNKPVFVNQQAKPQIHLSVSNKSAEHNLYFLDTAMRNWKFEGKDRITEVKTIGNKKNTTINTRPYETNMLVKPLKPWKASDDKQHFSIEIEPGSFQELFAYDQLKFEVVDESAYRRSDAEEQWETVNLEHTPAEGIYLVTFANAKRTVSYKVRPVMEGADYDAAMKIFNEKNKAYEQALNNRLTQNHKMTDSINLINKKLADKMNADMEWNNKMNAFIIARNKKLRELKSIQQQAAKNQLIQGDTLISQEQFIQATRNQWNKSQDRSAGGEIMRTFTINNFGIWNCDHPQYPNNELPITATFNDSSGNMITPPNVAVVYRRFNGITQFPAHRQIRVMPGEENTLWGMIDSSFYYFSYKDFKEAGINRNSKEYTFKMRKAGKPVSSYYEIRKLVEKM